MVHAYNPSIWGVEGRSEVQSLETSMNETLAVDNKTKQNNNKSPQGSELNLF